MIPETWIVDAARVALFLVLAAVFVILPAFLIAILIRIQRKLDTLIGILRDRT